MSCNTESIKSEPSGGYYRQTTLVYNEHILQLPHPLFWVVPVGKTQIYLLHDSANEGPHFLHGEVLTNTIVWSERERSERSRYVFEVLRRRKISFSDNPTVWPERLRAREEITWVSLDRVEMNASMSALR